MTLEQAKAIDREYLIPREVADILGADPQWVRAAAKYSPERLGFPVIFIGNRAKIPKRAFIAYMEGKATV